MANEKILNTRIQLKYDSYAAWVENNPTLKPGEVAIAKLVSDVTIPIDEAENAPVLFKVGPGAFNDLPWASALAADVYEWAKKNEVKTEGEGNAVTAAGIKDGFLTFTKGETFATKAELEELRDGLEADTNTQYHFEVPTSGDNAHKLVITKKDITDSAFVDYEVVDLLTAAELTEALNNYYTKAEVDEIVEGINDKIDGLDESITTVAEGTGISVSDTGTGNDHAYTVSLNVDGAKTALGLQDAAYETVANLNATAKGYADAVLGTDADVAGAQTVHGANKLAAAAKARIDAFIDGTDDADAVIDTLVEIQSFMTAETGEFVALSNKVTNIENGTTHTVAKSLDTDAVA